MIRGREVAAPGPEVSVNGVNSSGVGDAVVDMRGICSPGLKVQRKTVAQILFPNSEVGTTANAEGEAEAIPQPGKLPSRVGATAPLFPSLSSAVSVSDLKMNKTDRTMLLTDQETRDPTLDDLISL